MLLVSTSYRYYGTAFILEFGTGTFSVVFNVRYRLCFLLLVGGTVLEVWN